MASWWRACEESDFARSIPLGNRYRPAGFSLAEVLPGSLVGRVVFITGATAGIGREMAKAVAAAGATTVIGCRDEAKGNATVEEIVRLTPGARVSTISLDLTSRLSITRAATQFSERHTALHVLINNGGIPASSTPLRMADGVEECFQARDRMLMNFVSTIGGPTCFRMDVIGEPPGPFSADTRVAPSDQSCGSLSHRSCHFVRTSLRAVSSALARPAIHQ